MKDRLENMQFVKYAKNDCLEEYMTSVYFTGDILPSLKIFIGETELMCASYGLEELIVSISGITVNKLFISLKHIKNIKFGIQTIDIIVEII